MRLRYAQTLCNYGLLAIALLCFVAIAGCRRTSDSSTTSVPAATTTSDPTAFSTTETQPTPPECAPAIQSPDEVMTFSQIVSGYRTVSRRNVEYAIVFSYKIHDPAKSETFRVELPVSESTGKLTRSAWECKFACYGTRQESKLSARHKIILYCTPT